MALPWWLKMVKNLPAMQETWVWSLGLEDPLEKGVATHFSILAWRISGTEEPGELQSIGLERVRHEWATNTSSALLHEFPAVTSLITLISQFYSKCYFQKYFIAGVIFFYKKLFIYFSWKKILPLKVSIFSGLVGHIKYMNCNSNLSNFMSENS